MLWLDLLWLDLRMLTNVTVVWTPPLAFATMSRPTPVSVSSACKLISWVNKVQTWAVG